MAVSMMSNKKSSTWTTVKSKSDDKKKRSDEKKKQEVVEDRLGVTVPKKNVFAAMDAAWQKKVEQASVKVEDATPYAGAFTGLVVEQVALDEPESPATPPNSDRQASSEIGQRQNAEPKVKKPKKVKPSTSQVAQGLDAAALQASFQEWELKYEGNEVSQLQMLADFFLKTFKECELQFNNILSEKPLDKATEVPLAEIPAGLSSAVQTFLAKKHDESLKSLVVLLMIATFEGLPEGFRSKTGIPPPKAKVGLLTLLALVLRTRPQALVAATPEILQGGRNYTAPGRIPQLLWVLNQSATVSPSAAVAAWIRLLLPQLLGSDAMGKKVEATESKISVMDSPAHAPVLDYLELLLSKTVESDVELASNMVATVPGYALETISQSCFAESSPTRSRLQALFPRLQQLAASSTSPSHFLEWLPLALETACLSPGDFEGAGDDTVARATTSVVACLSGNVACHSIYSQKHKGQIKGSARVLQRLANSPTSVLKPITSKKEVAASFGQLLTQLPARHKFYLHQGRGKGWQGAAARAADAAITKLQRRVTFSSSSRSSSSGGSYVLPALFAVTTAAGIIFAAQHRHALVAKASEYLSIDQSVQLLRVLESVDSVVDSGIDAVRPHVDSVMGSVRPHLETAQEAVGPHLESLSEQVNSLYEQAVGSELGLQVHAYVAAAAEKLQLMLSAGGVGTSN